MTDRLLKLPEVEAKIGLGHTWIYERIKTGEFPSPVKLGERCVRWRESEISDWMAALPTASADGTNQ